MGRWLSSGREFEVLVDAMGGTTIPQQFVDIETSHTEIATSGGILESS
jgi:hypothetical protein